MQIITKIYDPKNVNHNQLKGSGIYPRGPICTLTKCKPASNQSLIQPKPILINRLAHEPLKAIKVAPDDNKWSLNGFQYPTFNSLWVNIPKGAYIILKTNG